MRVMAPAGNSAAETQNPLLPEGFLDEQTILQRLPISRRTLYQWRLDGLPHAKIGARVLFDWPAVYAWVTRQQRGQA